MAESEDMRQFRKLRELLAHIDGQMEYIKNTLMPAMYASFKSKYGSRLYKDKREELSAKWEEEHRKVQALFKAYEAQKNALTNVVKYILGGRAINSTIKGTIQAVANSIDNNLDIVLESLISVYPPRNTIPGNFASRHVARSRSRSRSPVHSRLQGQLKSAFINSKRHMRNRSKSRSPNRNESRNRNRNRNRNGNGNRKRTIRFNNKTTKYEIESLKTNNPFNNRSGVAYTPKEIKDRARRETNKFLGIYGNKPTFRNRFRGWMANPVIRNKTDEAAEEAREAAAAAAAAAEEARRIVSAISPAANIFQAIQTAADEATAAAEYAARAVQIADESFNVRAAEVVARRAGAARDTAIRALEEIRRTIASSPSAPAAAAASSNPQNRT